MTIRLLPERSYGHWLALELLQGIPGRAAAGEVLMVNLSEPPKVDRFTLIEYPSGAINIALYQGQKNAKGCCYRWLDKPVA
ncbi:MAG: hypothetical protein ACPGPF_06095 [Pontibacterium sp.]